MNSERISKSLKFVFFQVYFGFAIVAIALICVAYPSTLFRYTYSTQYYFLLIPLAITLLTAIMIKKELNRPKIKTATKVCAKCGKEIMQDMAICGYCGERQGND
jgi:hypothetical protein